MFEPLTRYVFSVCCILSLYLLAACSKSHLHKATASPSGLRYSPDSTTLLPGAADTSVTPGINWNGDKGSFTFAGSVQQGITIDNQSGKITWPGNLPIGNYLLSVVASNSAATSDTITYTLIVSGKIVTVAGTTQGFSGDGGSAIYAQLDLPYDVTVDTHDNLYISDANNNRIRMITPDGTISTIAGNGSAAFSGDGGPALQASLSLPSGVVSDAMGNLYITDYGYNRIRKINAGGTISTIAGSDNTSVAANFGDGGPATQASLYLLSGKVALDGQGSIYITDFGHQLVRQVTPDGIMHTITGSSTWGEPISDGSSALQAAIAGPSGVCWNGTNNSLYVASNLTSAIYRLNAGNIYGVAEQQPTSFYRPTNIVADGQGNLFVADYGNNRVRRIDPNGNVITIAGTGKIGFAGDGGPAAAAELAGPYGLAVDAVGNLYIADAQNDRIREVILH